MTGAMEDLVYRPGDIAYTLYGAGVIVAAYDGTFYTVRLWRIPGKSVTSAALARLGSDSIVNRLPAVPGMLTMLAEEKSTQVLVHCYLRDRDTYLVHEIPKELKTSSIVSRNSAVALDDMADTLLLREVSVSQLISVAPSAKFYPLFETLIQRADQTAAAARSILRSATTKRLIDSTGKAIQTNVLDRISVSTESSSSSSVIDTISPANLVNVVEKAAPGIEENFKQVMTMVKDEELTVLLQKCKGRLEQLASIDVSETTRLALEKTGIIIHMDTDDLSLTKSVEESRKVALTAIQQLLQLGQLGDLSEVKSDLTQQFTEAFDSLSKVAKSDRGLHDAFSSIAEKTAVWQEATGRLMRTRSAGLFLEGASRIQARAAEIFSRDQLLAAGEIGSKLTKSFTEGDAALSRLKSIELGEAVKTRLIEAIEIRSDSLGGLDGIIAGALSTGTGVVGGITGDNLQSLFIQLQKCASSATVDAHETLLSVLSSQSSYRDMAFLRIEQVVCDLGNQIGEDLSPDEIASIVQGEGGTSKIFAPIARRAMKQIEKQLDAAELQVKDSTVLEVLKRIRKLMSGKLTVNAILDDLVNVLNDDKIVAAGESIVQQSEQVLDAIEGVSANSAVTNVFQLAEKAGITKETVMREFEKLNMDTLLGAAQNAATDDKARQQLLSAATDTALDFVLRILPSMPVPAFEGVKDGLVYHISNLSMEGFRVRKEDIQLELAGMRATRMTNAGSSHGSDVSQNGMNFEEISSSVKATELLIIDIRNTSAVLENAAWSFEQTYLPYLKGGGNAHVKMSGGSIRLQFELRKRRKDNANKKSEEQEWEPVLCLHDRSCSISDVDLILEGDGKITWILNKIAAVFKVPLRDFVVSTIVKVLTSRSGWILERLNKVLSPYWDLVLRTSQLNLENLVEAGNDVIVSEEQSCDSALVELVWRERLPLGMSLLMNDDSGILKVVDFPRGSQARIVCEKRGFDPDAFRSASVMAVNGSFFDDQEDLFQALKDPGRPKTVLFRLADTEDAERLRKLLEGDRQSSPTEEKPRNFSFREVRFESDGELGIQFESAFDNAGLVVAGFVEGDDGTVLAAQRSGQIKTGDLLSHVNGTPVYGLEGDARSQAIDILHSAAINRPLSLSFISYYMQKVTVTRVIPGPGVDSSGGPTELDLRENLDGDKRRVVIRGFNCVSGMAEAGGILIGDQLVFVNGFPVGAGCRWLDTPSIPTIVEVFDMLTNVSFYPIGLTFARPKQHASRWTISAQGLSDVDVETICITATSHARLGIMLENTDGSDVVVSDFLAVPGVFQRSLESCKDQSGNVCLTIDSINGQFVPSYASADMVRNALGRSWKGEDAIDLVLCDDDLKQWISSQIP